PYPSCSISSLGIKRNEALLMQYRRPPRALGPSLNTCPRWASPALLRTSVRRIPKELSLFSSINASSMGLEKLGQPHPESNLSVDTNSGSPVVTSTYVPSRYSFQYSFSKGFSVALC